MMKKTTRHLLFASILLGLAAPCAFAQEPAPVKPVEDAKPDPKADLKTDPKIDAADSETFSGNLLAGYRSVGVGGSRATYRNDINLHSGFRLFDFNLALQPDKDLRRFADRVDVSVTNLGGDPFETLRIAVQKYRAFDFEYNHTKSTYFYQDTFPVLTAPQSAGDLHTFNFDRVHDTAKLGLQLTGAAKLTLAVDTFTKMGSSTTSQDLQRLTTVLEQPIDETFRQLDAGFEYAWPKATLVLDERITRNKDVVDLFLPGREQSGSTSIDLFSFRQPYDYTSHDETVRLIAHPIPDLTVTASALIQRLDLNATAAESSSGTFGGQPFTTDLTGSGSSQRNSDLYRLDATYLVTPRFGLIGSFWHDRLDQDGELTFDGVLGRGLWNLTTNGGRAGVQADVGSGLTVSGGVQYESRDVTRHTLEPGETDFAQDATTTKSTGYFATAGWRPSARLRVTGEAETGSYDDPFTLASPTHRRRYRLRGQYDLAGGFHVSGSYLANRFDNRLSGFAAKYDTADLRLGYQSHGLTASAGYGWVDLSRTVDQTVLAGAQPLFFPIDFASRSSFYDGQLHWQVARIWTLGAEMRFWRNTGSFGIRQDDVQAFVEYAFLADYLLHLGYRHVRYEQSLYNLDNYRAHIAEFSIGYRW